ncbi:interleukin-17A/F-3 precursor [Oryzias latipes]|uniref:Interleukin 17a/f3 n=2 Tax=Oryzias latipes TaxID=8090 RepID=E3WEA9_ORYLA|nr:interleukin 17a/f3 precursor [Oryzias latipes]BAJ41373.1 interleukin-17A/F-3 [Oryzias latipes]
MLLVLRALLLLGLLSLEHAKKSQTFPARLKQGPKYRTLKVSLDPSVMPQFYSVSTSNLANSSLSPWTYRENYNSSRLPKSISEAECQTSGCIRDGVEDDALEAKPIQYQILVLYRVQKQQSVGKKKKKKSRKYDFMLGTQVITVGCTCVRPSVITQQ